MHLILVSVCDVLNFMEAKRRVSIPGFKPGCVLFSTKHPLQVSESLRKGPTKYSMFYNRPESKGWCFATRFTSVERLIVLYPS